MLQYHVSKKNSNKGILYCKHRMPGCKYISRVPCTKVLSQEIQIFQETSFVFCKFYFVILPTCSGNCILIFTPLEWASKVLCNCVLLQLPI